MSDKTHITLILDRSGSMQSCAVETINAVNTYLANARKDDAMKEADFELTIFDNDSIDTIRSGAPAALADITSDEFVPRGMTPLYDAIGRGVDSMDVRLAKSGSKKAVLVVVTDGQENSSQKYPGEEGRLAIQALLKDRQEKGWLAIFLGAGLDAAQQGTALGIRAASTANIRMDAASLNSVARSTYAMSASYACAASPMDFMETQDAGFSEEARAAMGDESAGAGLVTPPSKPATPRQAAKPAAPGDAWASTSRDTWGATR